MQSHTHHHTIHSLLTVLVLCVSLFQYLVWLTSVQAAISLINIQILNWTVTISSPDTLSFSDPLTTSLVLQSVMQEFTGSDKYFSVWDTAWTDDGRSTTLQLSGNLVAGINSIPAWSVEFKSSSGGVFVISGTYNPNVLISPSARSFQPLDTARTFIYRDAGANSGVIWKYGQNIFLNISVPASQPAWSYVGTLIFTLIEN